MRNLFPVLLAAVFVMLFQSAHAGTAETAPGITTVIVHSEPGPALWKIQRDKATVWVLGVLDDMPEDQGWNTAGVRHILRTAHALILPMQAWGDTAGDKRWRSLSMLEGRTLSDVVSPGTYARFKTAVAREGTQTMQDYNHLLPVRAGSNFYDRFRHDHHIRSQEAADMVELLALQNHVPVLQASYRTDNFVSGQWLKMDAAQNEACLNEFLDASDYDLTLLPKAVQAWASADVATLLRTYRAPAGQACDMAIPEWRSAYETDYIGGMVTVIDKALDTPGDTLAVAGLSELLREHGVLDQIRARGATVTAP